MARYQDIFDELYGHYHAEAVEYGVEWTDEHDKFVEDAASDLCSYLDDSKSNWYNVEAPELPGLAAAIKEDDNE